MPWALSAAMACGDAPCPGKTTAAAESSSPGEDTKVRGVSEALECLLNAPEVARAVVYDRDGTHGEDSSRGWFSSVLLPVPPRPTA